MHPKRLIGPAMWYLQFHMRPSLFWLPCIALLCLPLAAQNVVIRDATVYTAPGVPPSLHATILVREGKIAAIGTHVPIPAGMRALPCHGCAVFAGFWNTHVHFTGPQWEGAGSRSSEKLTRDMQSMLTHSGFTTVVDVASDPSNTTALRRRVQSGEVAGPNIYTSGVGLYPPHGIPFYLDDLPDKVRAQLSAA